MNKKFLIIGLFFCFVFCPFSFINNPSVVASFQENNENQENKENKEAELDLDINSIKLGSSIDEVYKKLGKPLKVKTKKDNNACTGPSIEKQFKYNGLTIVLYKELELKGDDFSVISIEVTSPKWQISRGVKLGMDVDGIKKQLVTPFNNEADENGEYQVGYVNNEDATFVTFYFKGNKLIRVYCGTLLC